MKINTIDASNKSPKISFKASGKKGANYQQQEAKTDVGGLSFNDLFSGTVSAKAKPTMAERLEYSKVKKRFTGEANRIYNSAIEVAKISRSQNLETWHVYLAALIRLREYIVQVMNREVDPKEEVIYATSDSFPNILYPGCDLWGNPELTKKAFEIVCKQIEFIEENYFSESQKNNSILRPMIPTPSVTLIQDLIRANGVFEKAHEADRFYDSFLFAMPTLSGDKKLKEDSAKLIKELSTLGMTRKIEDNGKTHIEYYDKQAETIWKNIAHGNNVLVLNDASNQASAELLERSFVNLINEPGRKYGSLEANNTDIVLLNENVQQSFLVDVVTDLRTDKTKKGKTTVIVGNLFDLVKNTGGALDLTLLNLLYGKDEKGDKGSKVKFVFFIPPETYNNNSQQGKPLEKLLQSYSNQMLPLLNAKDAKKYLGNESGLAYVKEEVGKGVTKETVYRAIELTSQDKGNYPEKAINLIASAAKHFIDEAIILPTHVENYFKEMESLSIKTDTERAYIAFDTGKRLSDIAGMPMTRAEAQSIVRQIKDKTIGTRGYIVRHNYAGPSAGGRCHTAEAIAGEAEIPFIKIDGRDFVLKDIDALSQQASLSEQKIKNIFQMARAQAEANDLDAAMIFIKNFDNFGSNPLYGISSIFEQKAFKQLQDEMDAIRAEGKYNIIVVGSMNMHETVDENIQKPTEFLDELIIYQPEDSKQRREIIDYYIAKNGYKILDVPSGQRETILRNISETTQYFNVVNLIQLLNKASIISKEREKEAIDGEDFTEAFLQVISGRTNTAYISEHRKKIVTSHEAGHALNLYLMYKILEKKGKPWHLPGKVDFITLDPRGDFGGAMFFKESQNEEYSFEKLISEIVCDYGGHSAENTIYGINGSWGITADMRQATSSAESAVAIMGMGQLTGVRNLTAAKYLAEEQREMAGVDVAVILEMAKEISDEIIKEYKGFIEEFTEAHYSKVSTGECIIPAKQFEEELNAWIEKQDKRTKRKLERLESDIYKKIEKYKK